MLAAACEATMPSCSNASHISAVAAAKTGSITTKLLMLARKTYTAVAGVLPKWKASCYSNKDVWLALVGKDMCRLHVGFM